MLRDSVSFVFFLFPDDLEEMKFMLECDLPDYPVCIDTDNRIGILNNLSSDTYLLLDEKNRVVLTGNPVSGSQIKKSYMDRIKEKR